MFGKLSFIPLSVVLVALSIGISGCAYQPGETVGQNPVARKFTWFSYLDGRDIRENCTQGSPLRLRAVYNGIYDEQIRTYDLKPRLGEAGAFDLSVRVIGEADLSEIKVGRFSQLLDPWRGAGAKTILRSKDAELFVNALRSDGVLMAAPEGMELHSDDFYWIVSGCIEEKWAFHAFKWPDSSFKSAQFPVLLTGWDMTGIAINPPRKVFGIVNPQRRPEETRADFQVRISKEGLWGIIR